MAGIIKHKFQSAIADSGDATLVRPSNWNEEHAFATGSNGQALIRDSVETDGARFGVLGIAGGGTAIVSYAIGDLLYADTTTTLAKLADVAAGAYLRSGGVNIAPSWSLPYWHGQCILTKSGSNLLLSPKNGNNVIINSANQTVPDAGITLGVGGLAASTVYYIYVYMSGATMTLEASTTTHAVQAGTGVEIKSGDATRTLVGLARTTAGTTWADSNAQRFVLSWFNQMEIPGVNEFTANRTTMSAAPMEPNTEIRIEFLTWGIEATSAHTFARVSTSTGSDQVFTGIAFDGTTPEGATGHGGVAGLANAVIPAGMTVAKVLSAGYHYVTLVGWTQGGATGTWFTAGGNELDTKLYMVTHG